MLKPRRFAQLALVTMVLTVSNLAAAATMRVDYFHTGNSSEERFSLDRIVIEPADWPGNPARAVDDTNLGKYLFEVRSRTSNQIVYSRGFASIYGEWETTSEAERVNRTFSESIRFPAPKEPVQVVLKKRDAENALREIWSFLVDPADPFIDTAAPASPGPVLEIVKNGDPADKVDLLLLGDGYAEAERDKCESDSRRFAGLLFETSPFRQRRSDFNVWAICPVSAESGISRPSTGIHRRSVIGATYDAFGSERYVLTFENRSMRDVASFAPYDFVEILVNGRTYGGGGIFGLYATVAVDNQWAPYVFIHEFGHHFAGLADEYYTSSVAYQSSSDRVEPWEPNATALLDPARLKWRDLVAEKTPIPTLWDKEAYEKHSREIQARRSQIRAENRPEAEMEALFLEQSQWETDFFSGQTNANAVGAFEGAIYEAKGYYRPQLDCIMFSRNPVPFCAVCSQAIERVIDLYTLSDSRDRTNPSSPSGSHP